MWVNQSQKFLEHYSVCGELTPDEFLQVYTKEELIVADCFNENQILINVKLAFLDSVHYPKLGKLEMLQVYAKLGLIRKKYVESSFIGV